MTNYKNLSAYALKYPERVEEARRLLNVSKQAETKHGAGLVDLYTAAAVMLYHDTAEEVGLVLPINPLELVLVKVDHRTAFSVFGGITCTSSREGKELLWRVKEPTTTILKWIANNPAKWEPLMFTVADVMETSGRLGWNFGEAAEAELKKSTGLYTVAEAETKDSAPFWERPDIDREDWSMSVKAPLGRFVVPSKADSAVKALGLA